MAKDEAEISEEEHRQRRLLAALMNPHGEWPRDRFLLSPDFGFLPTPQAGSSIVVLLESGEFLGRELNLAARR